MAHGMKEPDMSLFLSSQSVLMFILITDLIISMLFMYKTFIFSNASFSVVNHLSSYSHIGAQTRLSLTIYLLFLSSAPPARSPQLMKESPVLRVRDEDGEEGQWEA